MNYLEIFGTLVGLVYLWLEYRASVYLWVAGIIMPLIYIVIYYRAGLYADLGINVYYVVASVYGLAVWLMGRRRPAAGDTPSAGLSVSRTPRRLYLPLALITLALTVAIALVLIRFTDSSVPWADSFTTALSVVALWMLARKYTGQWLAWILVDVVSCVLYVSKDLYFTSALYALYALIAYFGFLKWKKMIQ